MTAPRAAGPWLAPRGRGDHGVTAFDQKSVDEKKVCPVTTLVFLVFPSKPQRELWG